jgi:GTP-binding protein
VTSAPTVRALPPTPAEVAVVGRSNVGKSSLINALANRKNLAHVSRTPGRTRLLNLYEVDGGGSLVDLPGYGYAAASRAERARWPAMVEGYLLGRHGLAMVVVLIDGAVGPTPLDRQALDWLRANAVPHTVVATKHDKVRPSHRPRRAREVAAGCDLEPGDVVWVSASTGHGIDHLRGLVRSWLAPQRA